MTRHLVNKVMRKLGGPEVVRHATLGEINISLLREMIKARPDLFPATNLTLQPSEMAKMAASGEIDPDRVQALTLAEVDEPGIAVMTRSRLEPIDGFHRMQRRWEDGLDWMLVYVVSTDTLELVRPNLPDNVPWGRYKITRGRLLPL